jgi:methionyl-tRNA formyltransferase
MKVVFAGTAPFAVPALEGLCAAGYAVTAVFTQPDRPKGRGLALAAPPVKLKAVELGLPVHQPPSLKTEESRALFEALCPDAFVVVAYGRILPPWLVALPRLGALNLHGSLLPRFRGAAPIQWAMANGDTETGVCLMKIDNGLDTGPVYACESTPIDPDESVNALTGRLARIGRGLLLRALPGIAGGELVPSPQDDAGATMAPILTKEHGLVDWSLPARTIHNRVRAFQPWPGARTEFRDAPLRILRTQVGGRAAEGSAPGQIVTARPLTVACGDGCSLELLEVQLPNRKPQRASDFANGARLQPGEKLKSKECPGVVLDSHPMPD